MVFARQGTMGEGGQGFLRGHIDGKDAEQVRCLQDVLHEGGDLAESYVTMLCAERADQTNQRTEAAAVDEAHLTQLQHVFFRFQDVLFDFYLERTDLLANHETPLTANHGDAGYFLRLQGEAHERLHAITMAL